MKIVININILKFTTFQTIVIKTFFRALIMSICLFSICIPTILSIVGIQYDARFLEKFINTYHIRECSSICWGNKCYRKSGFEVWFVPTRKCSAWLCCLKLSGGRKSLLPIRVLVLHPIEPHHMAVESASIINPKHVQSVRLENHYSLVITNKENLKYYCSIRLTSSSWNIFGHAFRSLGV